MAAKIASKGGPPSYPINYVAIDKYPPNSLPSEQNTKLTILNSYGRESCLGLSLGQLTKKNKEPIDVPNDITKSAPYRLSVNPDRYLSPRKNNLKKLKSVYHTDELDVVRATVRAKEQKLLPSVTIDNSRETRRTWSPTSRAAFGSYPTEELPVLINKPNITISGIERSPDEEDCSDFALKIDPETLFAINSGDENGVDDLPIVFLSYQRNNPEIIMDIFKFAEHLRQIGQYKVWLDQTTEQRNSNIKANVIEAVKRADIVVMFVNDDYLESSESQTEARAVRRYNRKRVIVNMTNKEAASFSGDWFDLIAENRPWIDFYNNNDGVVESIGNELATTRRRPPSYTRPSRGGVRMLGDDVWSNQPYINRPDLEEKLRHRVQGISSGPVGPAILLVHGPGGVGKSSLIRHTLDGEFLRDCHFSTRVYLNVYEASNKEAFNQADKTKLYEQLAVLLRVQREPTENVHRALQNHLRSMADSGKVLLILDDICHRGVFECARMLCKQNAVIICVSRRNYGEEIGKFGWINEPSLEVDDMPLETLREIYRLAEKKLMAASLNGHDIVARLCEICNGLPLIAQAICGNVMMSSVEARKEYVKFLEMNYTRLLITQEYAEDERKSETIWRLLLVCFGSQPYEFRRRLYGFLMFERGANVEIDDLAVLWGCSDNEAEDFADQLVDMSFVRLDRDFRHYNIHVYFYDAILDFATKQDNDYKQFCNLAKLRGGLLTEARNELTGENLLHIAISRRREKLLPTIVTAMLQHDSDGDLLFNLTSQQNNAGDLYLHLLLRAGDWLTNIETSWEKSIALDTACYVADHLLNIDRFHGEELLVTNSDSEGNSIVCLLRNTVEYGRKWLENALHIAAVNDYYELLDFLLDSGADINTEDEAGNTALCFAALKCRPLVIYRLLQRDADIEVNVRNKNSETALVIAAKSSSDLLSCKCLMEESQRSQLNLEIDVSDDDGNTPLLAAVLHNKTETARFLLQNGAYVSLANKDGSRAIWFAVLNDNIELANAIYEMGGRLAPDENAVLKLKARLTKNQEMERLLTKWEVENATMVIATDDRGFPVYRRTSNALFKMLKIRQPESSADEEKTNAFLRLAYEGNAAHLRTLILGNKAFDQPVKDTALFIAGYFCHEKVVKFLCEEEDQHVNPNFVNADRVTALIAAATQGAAGVVATLIKAGADRESFDKITLATALIFAAYNGHLNVVNILLEAGANQDAFDQDGMTALMRATMKGHHDIVKALIAAGANTEAKSNTGETALMLACSYGQEDIAKTLVTTGKAMINTVFNNDGKTPLMFAAENCHPDVARILLANKAHVNVTDKDGWTAFMYALKNDLDGKTVYLLIPFRVDVNAQEKTGKTALIIGAENGRDFAVRTLLDSDMVRVNVNLRARDDDMSALMYAAKYGHDSIVRKILSKGAHVNETNKYGMTPFLLAVEGGHETVVGTLIRKGADVNVMTKNGVTTPLITAADRGYDGIVRLLTRIETTKLNAVDDKGATALMAAALQGHNGIVDILMQADGQIDPDAQNNDGHTALMLATLHGHSAVVHALLSGHRRADVTLKDKAGNTALSLATACGYSEIVQLINDAATPHTPTTVKFNDDGQNDQGDQTDMPIYEMDFYED